MMRTEATELLSPGSHDIAVDGLNQRYHVYGSGPVCLTIPGGPGVSWEPLRMPEVEQFLTMVYVEPLGTGGSQRLASHPNGYTRERYTRSLIGLLDRLSLPRVFLLGHSHGGFVCQHLALRHPNRFRGLVLYESAPVSGPEHAAEAAIKVAQFVERNEGRRELATVLAGLRASGTVTDDAQLTAALRDLLPAFFAHYWQRESEFRRMRENVTCSYVSSADENGAVEIVDDREALRTLAVPTLIVVGRYDVPCGTRWAQELHTLIPYSRLVVLEDSGHFGHLEEAAAFADALQEFAQELGRPSASTTAHLRPSPVAPKGSVT